LIIAVDFDGLLCVSRYPFIGQTKLIHKLAIKWVKYRQRKGDIIILNTCREGQYLQDAVEYLAWFGLVPNFLNENDPNRINNFAGDCRKISADRYIDDKNVGLLGWIFRKASGI
jgi:hypothetical protein